MEGIEGVSTGGEKFLKAKYDLHNAPEVKLAAERTEIRTGVKVPQDPENRIRNYLARFEEITGVADPRDREKGIDALKSILHKKYVIKPGEVPKSYAESQARILRERGQSGDWDTLPEEQKNIFLVQGMEAVINDQKRSLDTWVDYFASPDAFYPTWLKYYATRSILGLASYDKSSKIFPKRSKETTKPFPELNREALSYVLDAVERKYTGKEPKDLSAFEEADRMKFQEFLKGENFANLYAWAIEKVVPASQEQLKVTEGKWIKYLKGSEPDELVASIQGKGTGWCTAGESTARKQLEGGDFYVYYSNDEKGNPTNPRVAIRMEGENIGEVRGIAEYQNMDKYIGGIVEEKLKEFPDGDKYKKKEHHMRQLTNIQEKTLNNEACTKDELAFLYEKDEDIEGFGSDKDPRIQEIIKTRNIVEDVSVIFECTQNEVALDPEQINEKTKVYIGPLFKNMFGYFKNVEMHPNFPDYRFTYNSVIVGEKTKLEYQNIIDNDSKISLDPIAKAVLFHEDFQPIEKEQKVKVVIMRPQSMGIEPKSYDETCQRAKDLGLSMCPLELAYALAIKYSSEVNLNNYRSISVATGQIKTGQSAGIIEITQLDKNDKINLGFTLGPMYRDYAFIANN